MVSADVKADFKACVVIGPTAAGKTALAHQICDDLRTRGLKAACVNLDAFQFYKGVDRGTSKPTPHEIEAYNYRGVDLFEADASVDAQTYARLLREMCQKLNDDKTVPVCVGGSGLYLRAFLHGLDDLPQRHDHVRNFLRHCAETWGWPHVHGWLKSVDPERAAELHPNDKTRIERALEIFMVTGRKMSQQTGRTGVLREQSCQFNAFVIQVDLDDTKLRKKIDLRTNVLVESGWIEEVRGLLKRYGESLSTFQSMKAIGYQNIIEEIALGKQADLKALIDTISTLTWQYARRQRTWNAKEVADVFYDVDRGSSQDVSKAVYEFWNMRK